MWPEFLSGPDAIGCLSLLFLHSAPKGFFPRVLTFFPGIPFSPKHSPLSFPPKPPLTIMEDLTAEIPQHLELTRILENKDQDFNKSNPIVMDVNGLTSQLMSVCPAHANSTTYLSIHIPLLLFFLVKRTLTPLIQFIQTWWGKSVQRTFLESWLWKRPPQQLQILNVRINILIIFRGF